jgi:hypothetical protein
MDAEQGKDMRTGGVPALNIERIYSTTVPAEELARALADHFRAQEFEAQVFRASGDRTVMQARKESLGATSGSIRRSAGRSGWWPSRRCCWGPPTASGRRTS